MTSRKFSLRSLFGKLLGRRRSPAPAPAQGPRKSTSARERVRSGIEPLEGRIAPAVLVNGHMLTYTDSDGDVVTVNFSKDIFDPATVSQAALDAVFKFTSGTAHTAATGDGPQQLQLLDLGAVPVKVVGSKLISRVKGVSFSITAERTATGDGLVNIGAIRSGDNGLGDVTIAGDLGQIDAGTGAVKTGIKMLSVQSIGKLGTTTQRPGATPPTAADPAPSLESTITGKLGKLSVAGDMLGYLHAVDATQTVNGQSVLTAHGKIGGIAVGGSLAGDTAGDNMGRVQAAFDIGDVTLGGVRGGAGKNSGALTAGRALGNVTVAGSIAGGTGDGSGVISSLGKMGDVRVSGNITGSGPHSGGIFAAGDIASVVVGAITGGTGTGSGFIDGLKNVGPVFVSSDVSGGDGAGSGVISAGSTLANITINGKISGGKGANSGAILGGQDPAKSDRSLGDVNVLGALIGGEGDGSGAIRSGGSIGALKIGGALQGGIGLLSGSLSAGGAIESIAISRGVAGGDGISSATIQSHGRIGTIAISGDLAGGAGAGSASILSHELASAASPVAGEIGSVTISGKLIGTAERTALIQADGKISKITVGAIKGGPGPFNAAIISGAGFINPGATKSIVVNGLIEGGLDHSGYIEIGGGLGSFTAGGLSFAEIRVANDLGSLTINGAVVSSIIVARGEAASTGKSGPAIGTVSVAGNWTSSVLAAGVAAGSDGSFGTADDRLIAAAHPGTNIAKIAKITIGGTVEGSSAGGDHFGFVAQEIGAFTSNGTALALTSAGGQTFELGTRGDTTVREVLA